MEIQFENGQKEFIEREANIWNTLGCKTSQEFKIDTKSNILKIILGDEYILDIDNSNNIWEK
jgi:hypothetical protein